MNKSKIIAVLLILVVIITVAFVAINKSEETNNDFLRIHIRANSDTDGDQSVKLKVRDELVNFLIPLLADSQTFEESKTIINKNLNRIEDKANQILKENGKNYKAKAKLVKEEFPARDYSGFTLEAGIYDALIVELGEAVGANWWCVAYPPLCFVPNDSQNVVYKSKILEIIQKFKDKTK